MDGLSVTMFSISKTSVPGRACISYDWVRAYMSFHDTCHLTVANEATYLVCVCVCVCKQAAMYAFNMYCMRAYVSQVGLRMV